MPGSFTSSQTSVVLISHGSTVDPHSAEATYQQAAGLRKRELFREVREAFWKQSPLLPDVARTLQSGVVCWVPLLASEGYFSQQLIPEALGFKEPDKIVFPRIRKTGDATWFYSDPVGTHKAVAELIVGRADEVIQKYPFPRPPAPSEVTLFIAGHGTPKNENSRVSMETQAERIRRTNTFAAVHTVFLEEDPGIVACYELSATRNFVVVPFLMSNGVHARLDIPILLGAARKIVEQRLANKQPPWRNPTEIKGKLVWYGEPVGTDPKLAEIVISRVHEAVSLTNLQMRGQAPE